MCMCVLLKSWSVVGYLYHSMVFSWECFGGVCRQVVIPMETWLGMASSTASSSSASVMQLKVEGSQHGKAPASSEPQSVAVAAASHGTAAGGTGPTSATAAQHMAVHPQFIVPLQSAGSSPEPMKSEEASEPKRLRVAEEEWTSDS